MLKKISVPNSLKHLSENKKKALAAIAAGIYIKSDADEYPKKLRAKMMLENAKYQ